MQLVVLVLSPLFDLEFARLLNGLLELQTTLFLGLEDPAGLFLSLSHLLVQNLLFFVLELREVLGLFLNHLVADLLLLLEPLLLPIFLELIGPLPLLRIVILLLPLSLILLLQLLLVSLQLLVGVVELFAGSGLLGLALHLLDAVLLELFKGLALHQLTFQQLLLVLLDVLYLRLI